MLKKGGEYLKLKVIKKYMDKYTHEMIYPGVILDNATEERAAELRKAGVTEKVNEKPKIKSDDNTASEA